jgi:hypothetical protein
MNYADFENQAFYHCAEDDGGCAKAFVVGVTAHYTQKVYMLTEAVQ